MLYFFQNKFVDNISLLWLGTSRAFGMGRFAFLTHMTEPKLAECGIEKGPITKFVNIYIYLNNWIISPKKSLLNICKLNVYIKY